MEAGKEAKEKLKDCLFCKIARKELPGESIVYEDDRTVAFLDIMPVTRGHILVIPKEHTENLFTASPDTVALVMRAAHKITLALESYADGVNLYVNAKRAAGQVIAHFHVHVVPRFE